MKENAAESAPVFERNPDYSIYKPNSRGSGGVVRFNFSAAKNSLFVEAASQFGEKQFDWENKIVMKWTMPDIGHVLAALQNRQPQAKLFHQSEKANSSCDLVMRDDPAKAPYLFSISRQLNEDKSLRKVTIPLSHADAALLETAMRTAVARLLGW